MVLDVQTCAPSSSLSISVGFQLTRLCEIETGPVYFSIVCVIRKCSKGNEKVKLIFVRCCSSSSRRFRYLLCFKESLDVCLGVYWQNRWVELSNRTHARTYIDVCGRRRHSFIRLRSAMSRWGKQSTEEPSRKQGNKYVIITSVLQTKENRRRRSAQGYVSELDISQTIMNRSRWQQVVQASCRYLCENRMSQGVSNRCKLGYFSVQHIFLPSLSLSLVFGLKRKS